jgi:elongator complex protein 1
MAFCTLILDHKPVDVAISKSGTRIAVLSDSHLVLYGLDVTKRPITRPTLLWQSEALEAHSPRHVTFVGDDQVYVLTDSWDEDESSLWRSEGQTLLPQGPIIEADSASSLSNGVDYQNLYVQLQNGALHQIDTNEVASDLPPQTTLVQKFPAFAPEAKVVTVDGQVSVLCSFLHVHTDHSRILHLVSPRAVCCSPTSVYLFATVPLLY